MSDTIATQLEAVRARITAAAQRAGRRAEEITLVGVSKTHPPEAVQAALAAGLQDFGENRVQEAEDKIAALAGAQLRWHLIGHLQRNKARKAAALFNYVQSVDSLRLARALAEAHAPGAAPLPILLQVNVSGEASKEGFALAGWQEQPATLGAFLAEVEQILALPQLRPCGLMTIAPWGDNPEEARPTFQSARRLRDELARRIPQADWSALSMGMTDDFEIAIEEGATIVRIGRAIFGARPAAIRGELAGG